MSWLIDTLVWTAALLAAVLFLRRPVARWFGARAAYALWLLPFARLLLPPIELPAWLAPAEEAPLTGESATTLVFNADPAVSAPIEAAQSFDWLVLVPTLWAVGVAMFLIVRFGAYFALRRELLAEARAVGECGRVRLVETPAVASPLAFGVLDKVVALPPRFMAQYDRRSRDLALSHELAHHRGHDLLANVAVQPLFAMHWFNPLGWLGWRAMRRDQEAACDARVIAARGQGDRAAYAALIAGFAAGPRVALAAPMACPVLGDKSIVHRLRSLTRPDVSRRRRIAGRALLGAGVLALPLTASITYAELPPEPPRAPAAPHAPAAPLAPVAPLAPDASEFHDAGYGPLAPVPPLEPLDPVSPHSTERSERTDVVHVDAQGRTHRLTRRSHNGEPVFIVNGERLSEEEFDARMEQLDIQLEQIDAQVEQRMAQFEQQQEERDRQEERRVERLAEQEERRAQEIERRVARAEAIAPEVRMTCDSNGRASEKVVNGRRIIMICQKEHMRAAIAGLRTARNQVARNGQMSAHARSETLRALDREIARMEAED